MIALSLYAQITCRSNFIRSTNTKQNNKEEEEARDRNHEVPTTPKIRCRSIQPEVKHKIALNREYTSIASSDISKKKQEKDISESFGHENGSLIESPNRKS
ncbi:uncharacterized protein G2W53_021808 [Senna tora]|uniref:Uncharacterized protein n=1 Tax=Senna tora TaxID=362788 RepID=A0A834TTG4_9FABA|nr:uncharacterized protein G2W53_021808 [Senna tora]